MRKWSYLVLVLSMLMTGFANAETCETNSRGYYFSYTDRYDARNIVLDQCYNHRYTRYEECRNNLRCYSDGGGGEAGYIRGVNDRGYLNGSHWIELYGDFPRGNRYAYRSYVRCNGYAVYSRVDYSSRQQINVAYDLPYNGSTCYVRLVDDYGRSTNEYGPMRLYDRPRR